METPQEFWKPIINDFRPVGPVRPEDVTRFFVDRKEDDPARSLVQRLRLSFQNSIGQANPYKVLLTGHRGSGKSSELMRLGQELAGDFFVVWFDAELTLTEKANHFDVLLGMGLAVHAAAEVTGLRPDKRLADDLVKSLAKFVRKYEERKGFSLRLDPLLKQVCAIALVGGAGVLAGPTGVVAAGAAVIGANQVLKAIRLELNVRDELVRSLELPANRQEVMGALNDIVEAVQDKAKKPVLLMTDGLDKVPADRARLLFAESNLLTEPACALVYAAPIEFYHRLVARQATNLFDDYKMLPNLPVHKRPPTGENWQLGRNTDQSSLEVMKRVVAKRFEARRKGVDEIITRDALDLLARTSGGVMRELIRYFRDAAESAQATHVFQIGEKIAQSVIHQHRQALDLGLDFDHREVLRQVLKRGVLTGGQHETVEDELLRTVYLLSYQDDSGHAWFDVHPNVLAIL